MMDNSSSSFSVQPNHLFFSVQLNHLHTQTKPDLINVPLAFASSVTQAQSRRPMQQHRVSQARLYLSSTLDARILDEIGSCFRGRNCTEIRSSHPTQINRKGTERERGNLRYNLLKFFLIDMNFLSHQ